MSVIIYDILYIIYNINILLSCIIKIIRKLAIEKIVMIWLRVSKTKMHMREQT